jgi:hypothetical protein
VAGEALLDAKRRLTAGSAQQTQDTDGSHHLLPVDAVADLVWAFAGLGRLEGGSPSSQALQHSRSTNMGLT